VDDDIVEEEEDDDEVEESQTRDLDSTESTNPVTRSTSEHHNDKPRSAAGDMINSAGLFHR